MNNYFLKRVRSSDKNKKIYNIEHIKIAFQFFLMTVCSIVMGFLLSKSLSYEFYSRSVVYISSHFEKIFIDCTGIYDYLECILIYSASDIISVFIVFGASFAVFNYVVSDFILIYNGIKTGFAISFLSRFIFKTQYIYNIGTLKYTVFAFFKIVILVLILVYSYRAATYSVNLKKISNTGRPKVKFKVLFPFLVNTLTYIGSFIILNGLYCWMMYLLK